MRVLPDYRQFSEVTVVTKRSSGATGPQSPEGAALLSSLRGPARPRLFQTSLRGASHPARARVEHEHAVGRLRPVGTRVLRCIAGMAPNLCGILGDVLARVCGRFR